MGVSRGESRNGAGKSKGRGAGILPLISCPPADYLFITYLSRFCCFACYSGTSGGFIFSMMNEGKTFALESSKHGKI